MSNYCKERCIDAGKVFCPGNNFENGVCCEDGEVCPTGSSSHSSHHLETNWCSNYNDNSSSRVPTELKYLVCPNEPSCGGTPSGQKILSPGLDGRVLTLTVDKHQQVYRFQKDDVCGYVIKNPGGMSPKDWMWL